MIPQIPRRALATAVASAALCTALVAAAPAAQASTTSSCAEGYTTSPIRGALSGNFSADLTGCTFADSGAPYVINVAKLNVTALFIKPPMHYYFVNAVATCSTAKVDKGWLVATGCLYTT